MPVWERQGLSLVWCGDELVAVPGIGIDVAFQAALGKPGWCIAWRPLPRRSRALYLNTTSPIVDRNAAMFPHQNHQRSMYWRDTAA